MSIRSSPAPSSHPPSNPDAGALRGNAHIHLPPNFSAFAGPEQAVELAAGEGLRYLGASNYYDFSVYAPFARSAREAGLFPLFGLEIIALLDDLRDRGVRINDPGNPGKIYLCGKGIARCDPMAPRARALMATIRDNDSRRMAEMTARLAQVLADRGCPLDVDDEEIRRDLATTYGCGVDTVTLQERHLARAFQERLFARSPAGERGPVLERLLGGPCPAPDDPVSVQNEIRSRLMKAGRPAFVEETFVGFDHARDLVLALGGIPCYPVLADGAAPICPFEDSPEGLIAALHDRGIHAAEFIPHRNRPEVLESYVAAMRQAGIVVTAGTEHNTLELLPLEPRCLGGAPIAPSLQAVFAEGACVAAGHQWRVSRGEPGYVDDCGRLNTRFGDTEARIREFAAIGREAILQLSRTGGVQSTAGDAPGVVHDA